MYNERATFLLTAEHGTRMTKEITFKRKVYFTKKNHLPILTTATIMLGSGALEIGCRTFAPLYAEKELFVNFGRTSNTVSLKPFIQGSRSCKVKQTLLMVSA